MKGLNRIFRFVFNRAIELGDSELQQKRKKITILLSIFSIIVGAAIGLFQPKHEGIKGSSLLSSAANILIGIVGMVWTLLLRRKITDGSLELGLLLLVIIILPTDISNSIHGLPRVWPLGIVYLDVALYVRPPVRVYIELMSLLVVYLSVLGIESTYRFGIFNSNLVISQQDYFEESCSCESLPCKASGTLVFIVIQIAVLVIDFNLTREFAEGEHLDHSQMEITIQTVNSIAKLMADFDLTTARTVLNESDIHVEMFDALDSMVSMLENYKPYLPMSCFQKTDTNSIPPTGSSRQCLPNRLSSAELNHNEVYNSRKQRREFVSRKATLLVSNIRQSMDVFESSQSVFADMIDQLVDYAADVMNKHHGVVDSFLGDRIYCSFGTSRRCARHAESGIHAAKSLLQIMNDIFDADFFNSNEKIKPSLNIGMASGKLVCGDLGCNKMMRYNLIGKLTLWVAVVERAGCLFEIPLLIDKIMFLVLKESGTDIDGRLVFQTITFNNTSHFLYEIFEGNTERDDTVEWMFEQRKRELTTQRSAYNSVAADLLSGIISELPDDESEDINKLESLIQNGVPDPIVFSNR